MRDLEKERELLGKATPMRRLILTLMSCLASMAIAKADSPAEIAEAKKTQGPLMQRAMASMTAYAQSLKLEPLFVEYCRGELELHTYNYPTNGNPMFGFDYNKSTSSDMIRYAASFRANYELGYVMMCLAGVKRVLDEARPK